MFSRLYKSSLYDDFIKDLDTGDIILYQTSFWYSRLIEYFTNSHYSHISIILKKPTWLAEDLTEDYYLLESGGETFPDAITRKKVFGVQVVSLRKVYDEYKDKNYGHLYYRKLTTDKSMNDIQNKIREVYTVLQGKPYDIDPVDWLTALKDLKKPLDKISGYEKTDTFWCSALVAYVYIELGFLDSNIPWTIICPSDFCYINSRLRYIDCSLDKDKFLV
jgi:hypothetical protein